MPVLAVPIRTPLWPSALDIDSVPGTARRGRDGDPAGSLWTAIDASFPGSDTIGVALVPWVVELAARTARHRRLRHVAFVADIAFGGRRDAARIAPPLAEAAYRGVTATAGRLAREATRTRIWDAWEASCLIAACERILGRLRRACVTPRGGPPAGPRPVDAKHELAMWLLVDVPARAPADGPVVATAPRHARCAPNLAPRRAAPA